MMSKGQNLKDIRILEIGGMFALPYGTFLLGLCGAEIIRIESEGKLDWARDRNPRGFVELNFNKSSIKLNLLHRKGVELFRKLVSISDVVTDCLRPGVTQKLGIDYANLISIKPDIIALSLTGFGSTGPEAFYRSYAAIFSAMGGLAELTGYEDGIPTELRASVDLRAGQYAALAIIAALLWRKRTGKGQFIDLSARECVICSIGDVLMDYAMNRREQSRRGNEDNYMAPHGCYPCKGVNEWVTIAISSDLEWACLCKVMGKPSWTTRKNFINMRMRWENRHEIDKLISKWTVKLSAGEVTNLLQGSGIAAFPSISIADLFNDTHLAYRKYFKKIEPFGLVPGAPWKFSRAIPQFKKLPPKLGADNIYIFGTLLGLSDREIEKAKSEKIIW